MSEEQLTQTGRVIPVDIDREMRKSFLDYAMSVIVARALPDVRDGLKPVHRRIIYTMYENNLTPDKAYRKCADTVGSVLGRYHPHGDASVYDAMVRLAQDFSMRVPLVDGHGNFGSVDGDPPAAYRYTESRMSRMTLQMLSDIDKETVDFIPNYDDRLQEPAVLPARFPNLLVNGSMGIAVGMATNIPPHNLAETIDACCALLENPELELPGLMEYIKGPDFPTGGIIMGRAGIRAAYATGRGRITVRAKAVIEPMHNDRERIIVTELPYGVNKAALVKYIADLVHEKRIDQISDLRDESDKEGLRIVVELKKDANAQLVLNRLYSFSELQTTFSVNMLALCEGVPKVLSLKEALEEYLHFLREVLVRRAKFDLRKVTERLHILEGLHLVCDNTDEVISIIRHSEDQPRARQNLCVRFNITDLQSSAIVAMRLGQLSGMERIKIEEELAQIEEKVRELTAFLADEGKIREAMTAELRAVGNRYGDPRRTEIMSVSGEVDVEDLIPRQDCIVTLTQYGYIKRMPVESYQRQHRGGRGRSAMSQREEDFVTELFVTGSHDYLLLFTTTGRVFRLKSYELPEGSSQSKGSNIVNLLALEPGEKVSSMQKLSDLAQDGCFVLITKRGIIKRMEIGELKNVRKGGLRALSLDEGDELAGVRVTGGADELIAATALGQAIRFNESDVRAMGRQARGVRAITLAEGDSVVGLALVSEGDWLLTVSQDGRGRRSEIGQYRLQSRGGKGVINYDSEKNGPVAGVKMVNEDDDVILIADDGVLIRIPVAQIAIQSRYGGGVRVMRPDEGSRVVTLARTPREQEEEAQDSALSENTDPDDAPAQALYAPEYGDEDSGEAEPDERDENVNGEDDEP